VEASQIQAKLSSEESAVRNHLAAGFGHVGCCYVHEELGGMLRMTSQ
jgi:hypothetical protein